MIPVDQGEGVPRAPKARVPFREIRIQTNWRFRCPSDLFSLNYLLPASSCVFEIKPLSIASHLIPLTPLPIALLRSAIDAAMGLDCVGNADRPGDRPGTAVYKAHREFHKKDEIFQAVTENAADMIALVDVKGRRLYNSPAYKRVLGYSPAELSETSSFEQIHPDDRMRVLEAAREARESGVGSGSSTASSTRTEAGASWSRWPAPSAMRKAQWRSW